jgi:hypothetical protein
MVSDVIMLAAEIGAAVIGGDIDVISLAIQAGIVVNDFAHEKCPNPSWTLFVQ